MSLMKRVARELPLAEFTLRKYEKPFGLEGRELTRKLCLSLGLLQPGDSRDGVVDVLHSILHSKGPLPLEQLTSEVINSRKKAGLDAAGIAPSNVRRHLRRLRSLYLIDRTPQGYRVHEGASLPQLFDEKIEQFVLKATTQRVKEYIVAVEQARFVK
jgi:DNA-binding transcriptional ArsR family regulator